MSKPPSHGAASNVAATARCFPGLHVDRLANGLQLLVLPLPRSAVAVDLCVDAGAADEGPDEHGLAHLLEHMVFKGTARRAIGRSAAEIEQFGGDLNAWTSMDQTSVHAVLDADGWETAIDVIADMLLHPNLDPVELEREIEVVVEEIRSYADDPESSLSDAVESALWGPHPYGRRVLGDEADLRTHTAAKLRALLEREYGPNRARLVVVGPVDPARARAAAEQRFGAWRPVAPRRPIPAAPARPSRSTVALKPTFETKAVELAWLAPGPEHPDYAALEVLAQLLGNGASAMLADDLQHKRHLASGVWADLAPGFAGSTFTVGFSPFEETTRAAIAAALERVDAISRCTPGLSVARARSSLVADFLFLTEAVDTLASELVWYASTMGDPEAIEAHRAALAAVEPHDVERAVQTWLRRDAAVIGVIDADLDEQRITRAIKPKVDLHPTSGSVRVDHPKGPVIFIEPEDSPIVAVRLVAKGGMLRMTEKNAGSATAWARTITAGAGPYDALGFGEQLDALAVEFNALIGTQSAGFSATTPRNNLSELLDLLGHVVLDPHFTDDDTGQTIEELEEELRTRLDRPEDVMADLAATHRWGAHPWRLPTGGTEASIRRLNSKLLRRFHDDHAAGGFVIVITGGVTARAALDALSWLDDLRDRPPELAPRPAPKARLSGVHVAHAGHEQAHISLIGQGLAMNTPRRVGLDLASAVLDGQSGRLFLELRERLGLAYEVWAQTSSLLDGGTFSLGLATDPDRADLAAATLRRELDRLCEPVSEAELERARRVLIGRHALEQQRASARAASRAGELLFGLPPFDEVKAWLRETTAADVAREVQAVVAGGIAELRVLPRP